MEMGLKMSDVPVMTITKEDMSKADRVKFAGKHVPHKFRAERAQRSFPRFIKEFWDEVSNDELQWNWHIDYLAKELEKIARLVSHHIEKKYDLIVNVAPGTTKTTIFSIMFPVWCWTNWYWMRFITSSYSGPLSLESAEYSRDIIRSRKFQRFYPDLRIRRDKDTKSNFKIVKDVYSNQGQLLDTKQGGNRYSTSVGGTVTGFHGHIIIWDDLIDPEGALSEAEIRNANRHIDQTLSNRKVDKAVTPVIGIMQRLHQDDPTGHVLQKQNKKVKHICFPAEIRTAAYRKNLRPASAEQYYEDGLFNPHRMPWQILQDQKADLGQYGYAGQYGQTPIPPGEGMFQVEQLHIIDTPPSEVSQVHIVRYWDKAGTEGGGAYTCGVKMVKLQNGKFVILDVKRGQWRSDVRERMIRQTAEADGQQVTIGIEQEPGSGGKESAEATIRNLAGFTAYKDPPTGKKERRADPFSVQVNNGNVWLLYGDWNEAYKDEMQYFPFSTYKDQIDASSGAFNRLTAKKHVRRVL